MNTMVRRKIEMAARVRAFIRAHPVEGAGFANARTRFEELFARSEALAAQQRAGLIAARAASDRRTGLRRVLQFQLLRYLVGVGTVAAKDQADLVRQFQLPGMKVTHLAFLTAAKAMLAKAESQKELLVSRGMSENLLAALDKAVAEFEATTESNLAGQRDHIGARADLETVCNELLDQVRLLDGLVRFEFGESAELLAVWNNARHLTWPSVSIVPPTEPVNGAPAPVPTPEAPPTQGGTPKAA